MKEPQLFNFDKCKEIGKLEKSKEVVLKLNRMGILAFFEFGFFFVSLSVLHIIINRTKS